MAMVHPDRIVSLIMQNAVVRNEGLGTDWETRRAFWGRSDRQRSRASHNSLV